MTKFEKLKAKNPGTGELKAIFETFCRGTMATAPQALAHRARRGPNAHRFAGRTSWLLFDGKTGPAAELYDIVIKSSGSDFEMTLLDILFSEDPPEYIPLVAALYLYGAEKQYWKPRPEATKCAREILLEVQSMEKQKPEVMRSRRDTVMAKSHSAARKNKISKDDINRSLAITRACAEMEHVIKTGTNTEKLEAIDTWLQMMGWLAPKELRTSLARITAGVSQ